MDNKRKPAIASQRPISHFTKTMGLLHQKQTFLICTHINPDPDALSSQLALAKVLVSMGKKVRVVSADPIPKRLLFLPGTAMIRTFQPKIRYSYDAALIVDCGDLRRIGRVQGGILPDAPLLNIDHHITNELFGTHNLVITEASSTAEVLFDLFKMMRVPLTEDLATLLYLGIMTDTGSFRYDNTTAHSHAVVAELMKYPISVSRLYQVLYETISLSDIRYFTQLVRSFDLLEQGRVVCLELTKKTLAKFSDEFDLRDKIFRYFRAIKGVEVIVIVTEDSANCTRVNLRSLHKVDVGHLAYRLNGGGHSRASGCLLETNMKKAKAKVLAEIKKEL